MAFFSIIKIYKRKIGIFVHILLFVWEREMMNWIG